MLKLQKGLIALAVSLIIAITCVTVYTFTHRDTEVSNPEESVSESSSTGVDWDDEDNEDIVVAHLDALVKSLDVDEYTEAINKEIPYNYTEPEYKGEEYGSAYTQLYTNQSLQTEETLRNYIPVAEEEMGLGDAEGVELADSITITHVIILKEYTSGARRTVVKYVGTTGTETSPGNIQVYAFKLEVY